MSEKSGPSITAIDAAIIAHRAWVARFRSVITGISTEEFDPQEIRNDRICAFGQWLHANPDCCGDANALEDLMNRHKHFHEIAGQIAVMIRQHFPRDQIDDYMTEFDAMSKQLTNQLMQARSSRPD